MDGSSFLTPSMMKSCSRDAGRPGAAETAGATWVNRHSDQRRGESSQPEEPIWISERAKRSHWRKSCTPTSSSWTNRLAGAVLAGRGIAFIGTVGVLMQAKQQGLIADPETGTGPAPRLWVSSHRSCLSGLPGSQRGIDSRKAFS